MFDAPDEEADNTPTSNTKPKRENVRYSFLVEMYFWLRCIDFILHC
jgi:hypothetical protein